MQSGNAASSSTCAWVDCNAPLPSVPYTRGGHDYCSPACEMAHQKLLSNPSDQEFCDWFGRLHPNWQKEIREKRSAYSLLVKCRL